VSIADRQLTRVLAAASKGDRHAAAELLPLVYDQLRELARRRMSRLPKGQTIQPTALVHEAYLRIAGTEDPGWTGQSAFLAAASRAMRNILVDRARARSTVKRGGGAQRRRIDPDEIGVGFESPSDRVLALDSALRRLEEVDERKSRIVTMRCFGGLTMDETAVAVGVSSRTVEREWRFAKAWLHREITGQTPRVTP
jgi:RNA polymerase sigma factor (TIGR02999 family)